MSYSQKKIKILESKMLFVFKLLPLLLLAPVLGQTYDSNVFNDDVLGLIVFKAGILDPEERLASWNEEDERPCEWVGVGCDQATGRVTELTLNGFSLSGHIGRGLLRLQFLQRLFLSKNNFTGPLNSGLGQFGSLQVLDLSDNQLSGTIPDGFFQQCGSLRAISLAKNNLTGPIPDSLTWCPMLASVNLSSNWFSGKVPSGMWFLRGLGSLDLSENQLEGELPRGFGSLNNLTDVNLQKNWLSGELPVDIGSCSRLKSIDFSHNYLSGWLPESMRKLGSCRSMSLRGNALVGQVPDWIGEMGNLERLDLSANNLSGRVPFSIGGLRRLKEMNLSLNYLTGSLPDSMANCIGLASLDVSHNLLTGNLPPWMFKFGLQSVLLSGNRFSGSMDNVSVSSASVSSLHVLDLSLNALSGQVPSGIGIFSSLHSLNLSMNYLVGPIPPSIGDLKALSTLDLSFNHLNGTIPSEIGGAASLKVLRLEKNFLRGRIPIQIEKCSALTSLILSENNITGTVPNAIANLTNLQYVDLSVNDLSGVLPKELTNLSHLQSFNISHNHFQGELPVGGFFNTISLSLVSSNPSLCGSIVSRACPAVHPKPIVLNPNSSSDSPNAGPLSLNHRHKIILSISALIAIGAAVFIALGVIAVSVLNVHVRSSMLRSAASLTLSGEEFSGSPSTDGSYGKLVMFSGHAEFVVGTHALLNKECELGRGGFGVVYQTILRDGRAVAIKKLTVSSLIKSQEDFEGEVRKLGKIRHHNVVALEGYYWTPSLQLLIYEYVTSGNLYKNLHDGSDGNCLTWRQRFNIVLGMAKGLAHLHQMNITHYNLKSTNILIDNSGEPKVADFGLARLLPMLDHCMLSSKIQSALGYMAPEFACRTVKITEKCDVYGFGVLVLEVITGKKPVEYMEDDVVVLTEMVRGALEDGKAEGCIDGKLGGSFPVEEAIPVIKLGLVCASQVPSNRPDMAEVVNILELIQCPSEGQEEFERITP